MFYFYSVRFPTVAEAIMKFSELNSLKHVFSISELESEQISELQLCLSRLGYPVGEIDGLIGPKTRNAWGEFKLDSVSDYPELIGQESIEILRRTMKPFSSNSKYDFSSKNSTKQAIAQECRVQGLTLDTQIAYVLATAEWESNRTFEPVKEAYWLSEKWRENNLRYYPYYGRGFVQLTWENNYRKYSKLLVPERDLVSKPDDAMLPEVALFILVHGFKTGTFTGRKITDFINEDKTDFIECRRCINGKDKAHKIAAIAKNYLSKMQ